MKKAQAAMEFLMTYGWAIIIVLAAIGALAYFGVLSPQKLLPDRTIFPAPVPNVDNAVIALNGANTQVQIAFRNNKGVSIIIPTTSNFNSTQCTSGSMTSIIDSITKQAMNNTPLSNGAGFLVNWTCTAVAGAKTGDKFSATVTFDYQNVDTGQTLKHTGTIDGKFS